MSNSPKSEPILKVQEKEKGEWSDWMTLSEFKEQYFNKFIKACEIRQDARKIKS